MEITKQPLIGSYSNPDQSEGPKESAVPNIIDKREKTASPATHMHEGIQEDLKQGIEQSTDGIEKAKTYEEILAENDIEKTTAQAIVDAILTEGYYEETLQVTKSSSVTLRTRGYEDYKRYLRALEFINPKYVEEQTEIQIRYFLASSLVAFKGTAFSHAPPDAEEQEREDAFNVRMVWISRQGERVINLLANKLTKFDRVVSIVMSEGVVENF
jgi:DNA-directed RNA polymerase specialized sigma54-like protein